MSSSSMNAPPKGEASFSGVAVGFGLLLIAIAIAGYIAPALGVPYGFPLAASAVLIVAAVGLILPSFIAFRSPQDFAGGMFLIALAVIAIFGTLNLNFKTTTGVGPGMMPRATGLIVATIGFILVAKSLISAGPILERWSIRAIIFVLGSALVFGWTVRPLGLVVAGPLAVIISAFADRGTKWIEVIIFAAIMTAACIGLFSYGLKLPMPIWPTQMPYIPYVDTIKF